jgi:hypothetical protein
MLAAMATSTRDVGPNVTVTDLVAGVPVVVVAVVGTVSLAAAHLHHHSLVAVLLGSAVVLAALAFALRGVRVIGDRAGLLAVVGCGLLAAVLFLPGFSYGVGDKDPGVYTAHAVAIARDGSYSFTDPALAHPTLPVVIPYDRAREPGIWVRDGDSGLIVPQFFHLWPALLATSYDVAGYGGLTATTPLVAAFAVMALVGLLRRVGGVLAAVVGGVLLATNMLEVWQAKFPGTEALAQALFLGTLLWVVVAAGERWRGAAFLAGLLTGVGFLARADAWLLVMLAAGVLGALWVSRRADAEVVWGAGGLALVLPYAFVQAYGTAHRYTLDNDVPDLLPTLALLGAVAGLAVVGRVVLRRPVAALLGAFGRRRVQVVFGLVVCGLYLVLLALGFLRTRLFGNDFMVFQGQVLRSYDEQNVRRLAWFVTRPAFGLAGLGLAVVALRRWRFAVWAAVLPTLLLAPVFLWHANVAVRLMWWGRRYVPHVLPGLVVLVALAVAYGASSRFRGRRVLLVPSLLVPVALVAVYLGQSLPLRSHDEWHGSFGVAARLSALAGRERGVYLWEPGACCGNASMLFATPVWLERGELSVEMPRAAVEQADYVARYRAAFAGDPVFVVWDGTDPLPPGLLSLGLTAVDHLTGSLPMWEESNDHRPDRAKRVAYDMTVYRVP